MTKILIVRFSSIGDIVLTSPVIRCVKEQVHGAEVHYLTFKKYFSILSANPYIDRVLTIEKKTSEAIDELKAQNYDCVIDLHHNLRTKSLKFRLGKRSYSFPKVNFQKWLMVNLKINCLPQKHIVDRYFEAVKNLKVVNDGKGLDYFIPEKDEVSLHNLPVLHQKGYIGFVIGAQHYTKKLPLNKLIEVCTGINFPVVLLGGPEDAEIGEEIIKVVGEKVFNSCGKYNINQSASLVQQAAHIITHDTGLMHIAAAFKKDITSVWGNTIPQFGMFPYMPGEKSRMAEVKGLSCRPCSKIGYKKCPLSHFNCMNLQDSNYIADIKIED